MARKLQKLQKKVSGTTEPSAEDLAQQAKLTKKLAKLRKQLKQQPTATPTATEQTAASTESEDSAVALPEDASTGGKGKKAKKRDASGELLARSRLPLLHVAQPRLAAADSLSLSCLSFMWPINGA